jgi:isoamylase
VRGYTKLHPLVPEELRGTFRGLAEPDVLNHLRSIGVTAVELMPVHAFVNDSYLLDKNLTNYWGYNTIAFFAPDRRYAHVPDFAFSEFKEMVARCHDAGIEVILDVVYNHTAEGNHLGPTLSFRGIDNASYYRLIADEPRYYIDDTGTGNTFNLSHQRVLQMVTDSLRYWVQEMHVDGFRFDLGTVLAREVHGFDAGGGFLDSCQQDPVLSAVKLIAEPWDIGPGGYQVGGFAPGWAEWNDRYRDTVRSYWKGDGGMLGDFAARLTGSGDLFSRRGRKPWASVNFVTAHDGLTLNDLVSYDQKHNEANREDNRDGQSDNKSWNHGAEVRKETPQLFAHGDYLPLRSEGPLAVHVIAFARIWHDTAALTIICRNSGRLLQSENSIAIAKERWQQTAIVLSAEMRCNKFVDVLTGKQTCGSGGSLQIAEVFAQVPAALLLMREP